MQQEENTTFGFEEDFQKAIVSTALQDPIFILSYNDVLIPSYFDYDYLVTIIRIAKNLAEQHEETPAKMSVIEEVKSFCKQFNVSIGDTEFMLGKVEELYALPLKDVEYIKERVVDFGQRQALRSAVMKIVTMFRRPPKKGEDVHAKAKELLEEAFQTGIDTRDAGLPLFQVLPHLPQLAASTIAGVSKKIRTGFPTLDFHTRGGPAKGEVWGIMALPGRGKSMFLANLASSAAALGHGVVIISIGDLNEVDYGVRVAAKITGMSADQIIDADPAYMAAAYEQSRKRRAPFQIKHFHSDEIGVEHIRAYLARQRVVHKFKPSVLMIDHPGEMVMPFPKDLHLSGAKQFSGFNRIAKEFDLLTWVAIQPTRWKPEHDKDVLRGGNVGGSIKIFQKLDGLISWNYTDGDEILQQGRLWVDKTRRWKSFYQINCEVDFSRSLIKEGKLPDLLKKKEAQE